MPVEETRFMPFGQVVSNEAGRSLTTMTAEEDKLYRLESLSDGQRFSLEQLLNPYPLYAKYSG